MPGRYPSRPMGIPSRIELRIEEDFPHLPNAPITEAVIEVRTEIESAWEEKDVLAKLKPALADYPKIRSGRGIRQFVLMGPNVTPQQSVSDLGWRGLEFRPSDERTVAGFHRDSFVFSRLQPYTRWEQFLAEALRLWALYVETAKPGQIERIGLRFINQVPVETAGLRLGEYFRFPPQTAEGLDLPFNFFFHHSNVAVPGHAYGLNIIRALQPKEETAGGPISSAKLILDIDVGTTMPSPLDRLKQSLMEMRWLKNKAFFGNFTETAINSFR